MDLLAPQVHHKARTNETAPQAHQKEREPRGAARKQSDRDSATLWPFGQVSA